MTFTKENIDGLNVALNEATLLGIEFHRDKEIVAVSFASIAVDSNGKVPEDNRVQFVFKPVGKFIASYRLGRWDDANAPTVEFEPEQIFEKVQEFGHCAIYGWEFIDCKKQSNDNWQDSRLSFSYNSTKNNGRQHTIDLFQEGGDKHIDIKIWFDELEIFTPKYEKIEFQTFIDNGKRGWDGVYDGTASDKFHIYPAGTAKLDFETKDTNNKSGIITTTKQQNKSNGISKLWKKLFG
jgi:hypothetical protein